MIRLIYKIIQHFLYYLLLAALILPFWDVMSIEVSKALTTQIYSLPGNEKLPGHSLSRLYIEKLEWTGAISEQEARQALKKVTSVVGQAIRNLHNENQSIDDSLNKIHRWLNSYSYYVPGDNLALDVLKEKMTLDCNERVALFVDIAQALGIDAHAAREPRHQYVIVRTQDKIIHWETTKPTDNARFIPDEPSSSEFNRPLSLAEADQSYSLTAILVAHRRGTLQLSRKELIEFYDSEININPSAHIFQIQRVLLENDLTYQIDEFKRLYQSNKSPQYKDMRARAAHIQGEGKLALELISELVTEGYMQPWMIEHLSGFKWNVARGLDNIYKALLPNRGGRFYTSVSKSVSTMGFVVFACFLTAIYTGLLYSTKN